MRYRLIGVDLDGTLLDGRGRVPEANRQALLRAIDAGAMVVPCTGRAWNESRNVLAGIPGIELGVFVTGAVVNDMATGKPLNHAALKPDLALRLIELMDNGPEAVLVFREVTLAGHHYLVTGKGELNHNTRWWFEFTGASVHLQADVSPLDLHHALRVGLVSTADRAQAAAEAVQRELADHVHLHAFEAIQKPNPEECVHIVEAFASGVHKWRGLQWIAQQHGIAPEDIAVIGDEINDLSMLAAAGCSIVMGNGIEKAKALADYITLHRDEAGVAHAIDQMLRGEW